MKNLVKNTQINTIAAQPLHGDRRMRILKVHF